MLPIGDAMRSRTRPIVTQLLIAANVAVFALMALNGDQARRLTVDFGLVPSRLFSPEAWRELGPELSVLPLISFMFLHGGLLHLGSNMLFLWVFGDNVEERMGRLRFLMFYLACGWISGIGFALLQPSSDMPLVGASGAIAGVLASYAALFPTARIRTLVFLFIFVTFIELPAAFFVGYWFLLQILNGVLVPSSSNIAWWAHIFGFVAGWVMTRAWFPPRRPEPRYRITIG
jgi:membrane associated rhomboid family serine protease